MTLDYAVHRHGTDGLSDRGHWLCHLCSSRHRDTPVDQPALVSVCERCYPTLHAVEQMLEQNPFLEAEEAAAASLQDHLRSQLSSMRLAPADQVARALVNRGVTKRLRGDTDGAIADYTAAIELPGAPANQVALALANRGLTKGKLGDTDGAIADYTAAIELPGAPADLVAKALVNRGLAKGR
jgi:tetratricopeptide (TPR) repeat protein